MKIFIRSFLSLLLVSSFFSSCQTSPTTGDESELSLDSESTSTPDSPEPDSSTEMADSDSAKSSDEFAEFDKDTTAAASDENSLTPTESSPPPPPIADNSSPIIDPMTNPPVAPPQVDTAPLPEIQPQIKQEKPLVITGLKYKRNDTGATVVIEASGPISYTTRNNKELNQIIIEVPNAQLNKQLLRPLDTRDFEGSVGSISAYQDVGSMSARIVIQMRPNSQEPFISQEGNSVIVAANDLNSKTVTENHTVIPNPGAVPGVESATAPVVKSDKILSNKTLSEFLTSTQEFYGRRISIETNDMDIRDALRFLSEESGINMVISDTVSGKIGLRLRQVPWDQALVVIMRARNLGYIRQGNILRIAQLSELETEELNLMKLEISRKQLEPTSIRVYRLSYANAGSLTTTLNQLLNPTSGGSGSTATASSSATVKPNIQVVADSTSNSLIVTATKDDLDRVSKIVANFDTPPPQVLIEGKIVEASESFQRSVGISWSTGGGSATIGRSSTGPIYAYPSLASGLGAGKQSASAYMNFNLNVGTLDILGDLAASLALFELDNKVKILSSPKLVTLAGKAASIESSTQIPQRSITQGSAATQSAISGVDAKISLNVTPLVTADNSVDMTIDVKRDIPQAAQSDGTVLKDSRSAKTQVLVKNGQTAVLGGIYQNDETEGTTGIPYLKDVPVLGYLFKSKTTTKTKNELLIFVTPRIISGGDASTTATVSKDL